METVSATFVWIVANLDTAIAGVLAVIGGLSIIAKLTPTPADDAFLAKIVKVLDALAFNKQRNP